jgi:hypothetical protein
LFAKTEYNSFKEDLVNDHRSRLEFTAYQGERSPGGGIAEKTAYTEYLVGLPPLRDERER